MNLLEQTLSHIRVKANVFHNGHYCGSWAVDTSGTQQMTFHLVTHGQCYVDVDGQRTQLEKGDAVFFPTDAKHMLCTAKAQTHHVNKSEASSMLEAMNEDSVALVCGYFEPQTPVFNSMSGYFPEVIILRRQQDTDSSTLIDLMTMEAIQSGQSSTALLDRYADCLFYLLLRDHLPDEQGLFAAFQHPKLSKAIALIYQDDLATISLLDMAGAAGMSRSAFAALFKDYVGKAPKEFLTQWRMARAFEWLSNDGISTYDAALRTGYENEASFAKAFKRVMGLGPGAARSQAR